MSNYKHGSPVADDADLFAPNTLDHAVGMNLHDLLWMHLRLFCKHLVLKCFSFPFSPDSDNC